MKKLIKFFIYLKLNMGNSSTKAEKRGTIPEWGVCKNSMDCANESYFCCNVAKPGEASKVKLCGSSGYTTVPISAMAYGDMTFTCPILATSANKLSAGAVSIIVLNLYPILF